MLCPDCAGQGFIAKDDLWLEPPITCKVCTGAGTLYPQADLFEKFSKIRRIDGLKMWVTEKINGTNGQILVDDEAVQILCVGSRGRPILPDVPAARHPVTGRTVRDDAGKPVIPKQVRDNFGFACQVYQDEEWVAEALGPGRHYGEWAGPGIQKNPLDLPTRLFFLFSRSDRYDTDGLVFIDWLRLVPELYEGPLDFDQVEMIMDDLLEQGTYVADAGPDARAPEGVVVATLDQRFKFTPDPRPKGAR